MSQLAERDGQPGNWEEPDYLMRRLETVRFQEEGWQEPDESRDSCPILWGPGGERLKGWRRKRPTTTYGCATRAQDASG